MKPVKLALLHGSETWHLTKSIISSNLQTFVSRLVAQNLQVVNCEEEWTKNGLKLPSKDGNGDGSGTPQNICSNATGQALEWNL